MGTEIIDDLNKLLLQFGVKTDASRKQFINKSEIREYLKNEILFSENRKNNTEYVLLKGVVRRFIINQEGEIITLRFYMGASIITPHFFRTVSEKSLYSMEAMTDCVIAEIPVQELNILYQTNHEFKTFRLRAIEHEFSNNVFNEMASRSLKAKEKLQILRKNYRNLENLVSHQAIASYLGITNVSLSRLRGSERSFINTGKSKQIIRTVIAIISSVYFTSCSLTKQVLGPKIMSPTVKEFTIETLSDTFEVHIPADSHQIYFKNKMNDSVDLGFTIENVFFKTKNGNTLNGWFLKPKDQSPEITILHLHGSGKFLGDHYKYIYPLVENGFQILMFDYSGFGFSQGEAARENIVEDALASLDYLKARADVKGTKLVIYGQSLGAYYSTVIGPLVQNDIVGLVMEGPITSFKEIAGYTVPVIGSIIMKQGHHAEESIKEYNKPLLLIHSSEDIEAPFYMGKKIFDNANEPKEFYEIKEGHCLGPNYYAAEISEKIRNMVTVKYPHDK